MRKTLGIYPTKTGISWAVLQDGQEPRVGTIQTTSSDHLTSAFLFKILMEEAKDADRIQISALPMQSPMAAWMHGLVMGCLSCYDIKPPIIVPGPDMMAAISLGPKSASEKALLQVFKLWQLTLSCQAEALALAVAHAVETKKGTKGGKR